MVKWVEIKDYEGIYKISNNGDIESIKSGRILKYWTGTTGYKTISLSKNGVTKKFKIHKLVALHFIINPKSLNVINHIDGNKINNYFKNLEWCTYKHNNLHAYAIGLKKASKKTISAMNDANSKAVNQFNINGVFIRKFKSISEASSLTNISIASISACAVGKHKTSGGFKWVFV